MKRRDRKAESQKSNGTGTADERLQGSAGSYRENLAKQKEYDRVKRMIAWTLALVCILALCGCNSNTADTAVEHEAISVDYGKVTDLAKAEFAELFKEFEDVQIEETATMTRTDDAREIVVQFKYSSSSGDGVYGFLYHLDDYSNPELVHHGEDISSDSLIG